MKTVLQVLLTMLLMWAVCGVCTLAGVQVQYNNTL